MATSLKSSSSNGHCHGMSKRCASAEAGGTRHVTELAVLLGLADTRAVTKTRTPGTKATGGGARDALEPMDTFQAATFRSAAGLIGYIVLDRPDCQYDDWMRMLRLAKFPVAHSELGWLYQAQDVPEKYDVYGDSAWVGSDTRRSSTGAFEQLGTASPRIQLLNSARRRSLMRRGRAACNGMCGSRRVAVSSAVVRGWNGSEAGSAHGQYGEPWHAQPCWTRASSASGREVALWTQEAVQAGRFSLKKLQHVSDLTTNHYDEERLKVLMTLGRLRHTRGPTEAGQPW